VAREFLIDRPASAHATLILAHSAGAPMDTPFMEGIAARLAREGVVVVRFEFAYMRGRRTGKRAPPDKMPVLEARFREVVASMSRDLPLFVAGKSMGARVATQLADELDARGAVALGYPFHPPKQSDRLRIAHLTTLRTPCLIVQGTRDPFGGREEVASYQLSTSVRVHWLEDGDHSFVPRKKSGRSLADNLDEAAAAMSAFIREQCGPDASAG
jgi:predicted alpha/beta-hydrolase family hydrolase